MHASKQSAHAAAIIRSHENPLTGLCTPQDARLHLRALHGGPIEYAVVVVSLLEVDRAGVRRDILEAAFDQSLRLAVVGELIRRTFEDCEVVAALSPARVLAVVRASEWLPDQADEFTGQLRRRLPTHSGPRVVVEPLPASNDLALALLDDLAGAG